MWRRFVQFWREMEAEHLAVLESPTLAPDVPAGYRRTVATRIAQLSEVERRQLAAFSRRYGGRKSWIPMAWIALAFSAAGVLLQLALFPGFPLHKAVVGANAIGFTCVAMYVGAWFNYRQLGQRLLRVIVMTTLLAICGALLGFGLVSWTSARGVDVVLHQAPRLVGMVGLGVIALLGVPLMVITHFRNREYAILTADLQRNAERDRLARDLSETRLRLLRAQIEPHFLFNTLGAVQQLAEQGAPRAAELTADLIAFLRASLNDMRSDTVALADEFRLINAYLRVMQVRLGPRLHVTLVLPVALEAVRLPGMLLLTLVENAIKHGIEPALRGGNVTVIAEHADDMLRLQVQDTGVGLAGDVVDGTGLANVRRRLELAHAGAASLVLTDADPGTLAVITLPLAP